MIRVTSIAEFVVVVVFLPILGLIPLTSKLIRLLHTYNKYVGASFLCENAHEKHKVDVS